MLRIFFSLFLPLLCSYATADVSSNYNRPVLLLSYQKSGNTFLRYCLEYLTGRPTWSETESIMLYNDFTNVPQFDSEALYLDGPIHVREGCYDPGVISYTRPGIFKTHFFRAQPLFRDPIILIIRNFKHGFLRTKNLSPDVLDKLMKGELLSHMERQWLDYWRWLFRNVRNYDAVTHENKIHIYYEDFIAYPRETLSKLMLFLGVDEPERLEDFLENLAAHKKRVLSLYGDSRTGGNLVSGYYSEQINQDQEVFLTNFVKKKFPYVYEKYFFRYGDPDE